MEIATTHFNAGDRTPDWLLSVEPMGPGSVKGEITFGVPCKVLEFADHYMVFPEVIGPVTQVMSVTGEGCRIVAAGKNVHVAIGTMVITGEVFHRMQAGQIVGPAPPAPVAAPKLWPFDQGGAALLALLATTLLILVGVATGTLRLG